MKKLLSLIILGCLMFGFTVLASAETKVSFDVLGSGSSDLTYKDTDLDVSSNYKEKQNGDISGFLVGLESSMDKFKVGVEYGVLNTNSFHPEDNGIKNPYDKFKENIILSEAKAGYRVVDQDIFKLDLTMAVLSLNTGVKETDYPDEYKYWRSINGDMLGVDVDINFTDRASLQTTFASSLLGAYANSYADPSLTEIKLKFNYLVTDNWAVTLGYRKYTYSGKLTGPIENYGDNYEEKLDGSIDAISIGGVYKF